ncbi:hypothetical protein FKR81_23390 [Lentzea tibetensis]|uniref:Uncharacterized protein n=1 Tax=Lentzea tibetensis TaxID=2591470 RepID=A0A563EPY9_9PSEU|nr:hypothetical protein [Lentzea tibetensis]TWP49493.1 hypothetical protein FKR81_23390 [Lentzea tibetensis]
MELVPLDDQPGVAEAALPTDEPAVHDLLARAAAAGLHTVVVTLDPDDSPALDLLRELRVETQTVDGRVVAELDSDPSGQLAHLRTLSVEDREAWLATYSRASDPNWWMHRLLVLNHHPEWTDLKAWLVDHHVKVFGRPPGRARRASTS